MHSFDVKTVLTEDGDLTEIEKCSIRIELRKEIEKRLNSLMDCELAMLDYWLIPGMLNERVVTMGGREFELHVETIVVSETLGVLVRAKPKEKVPLPAPALEHA